MADERKTRSRLVYQYLQRNWLPLFSAFVIGLGFPLWRLLVFEQPRLNLEIMDITFSLGSDAVPSDHAALGFLRDGTDAAEPRAWKLDDVARQLDAYEDETRMFATRVADISTRRREIDATPMTPSLARQLNAPLQMEVEIDDVAFRPGGEQKLAQMRAQFAAAYDAEIARLQDALQKRSANIRHATDAIAQLRQDADRAGHMNVECAVTNTGAAGVTVKPHALLRVYLNGGAYFDIPLRLDRMENAGEIPARTSKPLTFASEPLREMPSKLQQTIQGYFGQNVRAKLYLYDMTNKILTSQGAPFVRGLLEQKIFDKLAVEAAKDPAAQ